MKSKNSQLLTQLLEEVYGNYQSIKIEAFIPEESKLSQLKQRVSIVRKLRKKPKGVKSNFPTSELGCTHSNSRL
jgi:hypothetical protein